MSEPRLALRRHGGGMQAAWAAAAVLALVSTARADLSDRGHASTNPLAGTESTSEFAHPAVPGKGEQGAVNMRGSDAPLPLAPPGRHRVSFPGSVGETIGLRTPLALGIVVLAIVVGLSLARRWMPGLTVASGGRPIRILSQAALGPRGTIYLVQCGPRVLVLGATPGRLTTLAEIADPEEVNDVCALCAPEPATRRAQAPHHENPRETVSPIRGEVKGLLEKIDGWKSMA